MWGEHEHSVWRINSGFVTWSDESLLSLHMLWPCVPQPALEKETFRVSHNVLLQIQSWINYPSCLAAEHVLRSKSPADPEQVKENKKWSVSLFILQWSHLMRETFRHASTCDDGTIRVYRDCCLIMSKQILPRLRDSRFCTKSWFCSNSQHVWPTCQSKPRLYKLHTQATWSYVL